MKKLTVFTLALVALLALGLLSAGCGGGEDTGAQAESADSAGDAGAAEVIATHDCEGGCGMKDVPEDQMKQVDGKWLCAGCVKKAEAAAEAEGHGDG